jgi:succinate dehydrogenase/fumarate reductase flavoprotein subunit
LSINFFRSEPVIRASLDRLHGLVPFLHDSVSDDHRHRVRAREAAGMVATARWMYSAALARKESRGLHGFAEYPQLDPRQTHRLLVSGVDRIHIRAEKVPHASELTPEEGMVL